MSNKTAVVAFQESTATPTTGSIFNDVMTYSTGEAVPDLMDVLGNATGWGLQVNNTPSGGVTNTGINAIPTGDAAWVEYAEASDEAWFISTGASDANALALEWTGLDDEKRYTLQIYCARFDDETIRFVRASVDDFATAKQKNVIGNASEILSFEDIEPVNGSVVLKISSDTEDGHGRINTARLIEQGGDTPRASFTDGDPDTRLRSRDGNFITAADVPIRVSTQRDPRGAPALTGAPVTMSITDGAATLDLSAADPMPTTGDAIYIEVFSEQATPEDDISRRYVLRMQDGATAGG